VHRTLRAVAVAAAVLLSLAPLADARKQDGVRLSVVGYSTIKDTYAELIPMFQATSAGKDVTFSQSYGASTDQSRAVANGQPVDVVALSLAPDIDSLVNSKLVSRTWRGATPSRGMVTDSIVVFVVRKGNPKNIRTWADLLKPGVQVLTPNPFSSGAARWNIMAAFGAQLKIHRTEKQATQYLTTLFKDHVAVQDKSGRDALNTFLGGKGDVLLTYENEAINAQQQGKPVDFVRPRNTLLIENPIAVTTSTEHPTEAKAFVSFLLTPAAQDVFAKHGYRPVDASTARKWAKTFPKPAGLFTINDLGLGGWSKVSPKFFDPTSGIVAKIERET
jgi:sulfate/thiosulfate-binding protein